MKKTSAPLFVLFCCVATACHRPYALYQRTAPQTFHSPRATSAVPAVDSTDWAALAADSVQPAAEPVAYASARPGPPTTSPSGRIVQLLTRASSPTAPKEIGEQAQPKPKPKTQTQRKTLREVLGLPPRRKLNWWQRISWRLKASVVIILVAVVFAILHITVLAIIFGIIGAFVLLKGLKKSFKVRRPLF